MPELTPQDISNQQFRSVFRGFDPVEVRSFLDALSQSVAHLTKEREALSERLAEVGERDLKTEFESIGREVAAVLEAARDAADQLRQRASNDATRWRSEAVSEAEQMLRQSRSDAERLRSDAWTTADELLKQAVAEADRIHATTEKERLRLVGEAERESHRVVATGRREAEDQLRNAKMEAERLTLTAQSSHDEMIEHATRQSDASQERTRALEIRRQELKAELDAIRHALATAEGELEERRSALALSPPTSSPVPPPDAVVQSSVGTEEKKEGEWTPGETVRVVRPGGSGQSSRSTVVGPLSDTSEIVVLSPEEVLKRRGGVASEDDSPADATGDLTAADGPSPDSSSDHDVIGEDSNVDVADVDAPEDAVTQPDDAVTQPDEPPDSDLDGPDPDGVDGDDVDVWAKDDGSAPSVDEVEEVPDEVSGDPAEEMDDVDDAGRFEELSGLFARLREPGQGVAQIETVEATAVDEPPAPTVEYRGDAIELRSRLLLPVSNRALRNIKRQLTEAQNEALEELRLSDGAWEPDGPALGTRLRPDLVVLAAESYAAGHAAAMEMADSRFKRPATPKTDPENDWVAALLQDLNHALAEGRKQGQGSRELGASVSRVFRSWRTDEAERRVSDLSAERYHAGFADVLTANGFTTRWVVSGRGCATCKSNGESVPGDWDSLPPAHANCGCALIIV